MHGITILYEYSGDEAKWRAAIDAFLDAIAGDPDIAGRFHYRVQKAKEGPRRVHWGSWDVPETVQKLQSRDYFKAFAKALQEMAGDSLQTVPVDLVREV